MPPIDVSIIIPTYNRSDLVADAIDSCIAQQKVFGLNLQIVVVDDCSTDGTLDLLASYGDAIFVIALEKNEGHCRARNAGLRHARGTYVKFLDSDDVLVRGVLAEEVALAERNAADIVVSGYGQVMIDGQGNRIAGSEKIVRAPEMNSLPDTILLGRAAITSSALYRSDYIKGLEWDPEIVKLADWDWFCQAALRRGKIVALEKTSFWYRHHPGPRVVDAARITNARCFYRILEKIEARLAECNDLTPARKKRLAQYYYKELRTLCVQDRDKFHAVADHIVELDRDFHPVAEERQPYMRLLCRLFGFRPVLLAHTFLKKMAGRVRR
jgi:glycosyltransferase involved in cell wall biosynthesis